MTEKEAVELLKHHSFTHEDFDNPKSQNGFLGMLRPFGGELFEDNFHELMDILQVLKGKLNEDKVDKELVSNFWSICHLSRMWGIEEGSMLRRNNLISDKQIALLAEWTDCISYTIMNLLEGLPDKEAFEGYAFYLADRNGAAEV